MDLSKKSNKQEKLKSKITDYNNKNSEYLKKSKMKKKINLKQIKCFLWDLLKKIVNME